ncbi:MAG: hypothetical protein WCV84_02975 [Patescibacteria group bacterium]
MRKWIAYPLVFFLSAFVFALLQPWGMFVDPDAFYHAKITTLMMASGALHAFPWLDLTTLGTHFADHHYLFHVGLMPFLRFFGTLPGIQIAAVTFGALFMVALYAVLNALKIERPWFWLFAALTQTSLLFRLSLGKASPWALIFFVIGLAAVALRKPILGAIIGALFALSHGGWEILLGAQGLYVAGELLFLRSVERRSWKESFLCSGVFAFFATIIGCVVGIVLHPNFPDNIAFLWVQIVKIGVLTPMGRVRMGDEWLSTDIPSMVASFGFLLVASLGALYGMLFARKPDLDRPRAKQIMGWAFVFAALFVLTLKSRRMVEYLVPVAILWVSSLWTLVDVERLWQELRVQKKLLGVFAVLIFGMMIRAYHVTYTGLRADADRYDADAKLAQTIAEHTEPGERVFHTRFDEFPELFYHLDRQKYVVGLDPTFLLEKDPARSDALQKMTDERDVEKITQTVREQFDARLILVSSWDPKEFLEALATSTQLNLLYKDERNVLYEMR